MKNFNFFEKLWEHSRTLRRVGLVLVMCLISITQAWAGTYTVVGIAADNPNNYDVKWRAQLKTDGDGQWVEDYSNPKAATGITFEGKPLYVCWWDDWFNGVNNLYLKYVDGATEKTSLQFEGGYGWVNVGDYNHRVYNFDSNDRSKYANKTMKKGTRVYFDATGWSGTTIKLVTGHMAHQKYYTLSRVTNTKLYYGTTTAETWYDAIGWGVVSGTTYADGNYDDRINKVSEQATEYTGWKNWDLNNNSDNNAYLCVNNGKAGEEPSMSYHSSFYSNNALNYTQSVYFVTRDNGSYSTMSSGKTPATITMSSYKFVSGTYNAVSAESPTAMSVGGTTYSRSFTAAHTATTTLTVSNVLAGYKFDGWYDAATGGSLLESNTTYTYYPTAATNVYARFTKQYAFIEGKFAIYNSSRSTRSYTNASGSWVTDATTIPMTYDATNDRFYVHTYSTLNELKEQITSGNDPYFIVKTSSSSSVVNNDCYEFFATSSSDSDKQLTAAGYENRKGVTNTSTPGSFTFIGNSGGTNGYVVIYCDGSDIWYELEYTVTYNPNGGECATSSERQSSPGASLNLPTPTRDGCTFEGWYDASGTKAGASYTPTTDITLYAHWTDNIAGKLFSYIDGHYGAKYKSFNGTNWVTSGSTTYGKTFTNGTTGVKFVVKNGISEYKSGIISTFIKHKGKNTATTDTIFIPTGKIASVKILYGAYSPGDGKRLTVNGTAQTAPPKTLVDAQKVVTDTLIEITLNNQKDTLELGISNTSNNLYIARVSATITGYTVTYNKGTYGSGSLASGTKTHDVDFTLSSADDAFTRTGYTYDGWSTSEDGSSDDYDLGDTYTANAAITLYPHWAATNYTLSYDLAGGSVESANPMSYTIESSAITLNNPTKPGYTFAGWTGTGLAEATTTVTIAAGSTGNRSYTATWTAIVPSSVSLNKSSTTITEGGTETLTATISPAVVADNTITWTTSDGDVATVDDGVVTAVAAGTATITATTVNGKTATCEVTVAAAVTYTVTYDAQGGSVSPASEDVSTATLPTPTKSGYTFQGWYTSGGALISGTYNPTADITLHALWREDECSGGGGGGSTTLIDWTPSGLTDATKSGSATPSGGTITYAVETPNNNSNWTTGSDSKTYYKFGSSGNYTLTLTAPAAFQAEDIVHVKVTATSATTVGFKLKEKGNSATQTITGSVTTANTPIELTATLAAADLDNGALKIYRNSSDDKFGQVWVTRGSGSGTCYYVTYNGNGADGGFTKDEASHASGSNVTVASNSFTKTGYIFTGWKTEPSGGTSYAAGGTISGISGNMTLYAQWAQARIITADVNEGEYGSVSPASITVADGSTISISDNVLTCDGKTLTATATTSTAQYTYAFSSWTGVSNGDAVTADVTATANFTRTLNSYTITWLNYDGTTLETDENVDYGDDPSYNGSTPTKASTASHTYAFNAWSPTPSSVTGDATYTATFTETARSYSVAVTLTDSKATQESGTTGADAATYGTDYEATFKAVSGYKLPDDVTVSIGGSPKTKGSEYTWSVSEGVGTLTIDDEAILGNITITVTAEALCTDPDLSFASASKSVTLCDAAPTNALTNTYSVSVSYDSSDKDVATVAADGSITLVGAGTTTITASFDGNATYCEDEATYTITVASSTAAGLSYSVTSMEKDNGASKFTNALSNSNSLSVTYSSSDEDVATVDSNGEVTIKAAGTTTITAHSDLQKVSSTCYAEGSASYTLKVYPVYTVTYNAMGGTCATESANTSLGKVTLPTPSHDDYSTFLGWYSGDSKIGDADASYGPTTDITLYAKWSGDCDAEGGSTTVSIFDGAVDTKNSKSSDRYDPDHKEYYTNTTTGFQYKTLGIKDELIDISTPTSYTDRGSYVKAIRMNGSGNSNYIELKMPTGYTAELYVAYSGYSSTNQKFGVHTSSGTTPNGSNCDTWNASISDGTTVCTATIDLSANTTYYLSGGGSSCLFEEIKVTLTPSGGGSGTCYTVTYNGNGATGGYTNDPLQYEKDDDPTILANGYTKTGYIFRCWNTAADRSGTDYSAGDTYDDIADDVILYAIWVKDEYVGKYTFHYGESTSGAVDDFTGTWTVIPFPAEPTWSRETDKFSDYYYDIDFTMPDPSTYPHFWVGYEGYAKEQLGLKSGFGSAVHSWSDVVGIYGYFETLPGAKQISDGSTKTAVGATGTLEIHKSTSAESVNLSPGLIPSGYGLTIRDNSAEVTQTLAFHKTSNPDIWETDVLESGLTSAEIAGTFKVSLATGTENVYVDCYQSVWADNDAVDANKDECDQYNDGGQNYPNITAGKKGRFQIVNNNLHEYGGSTMNKNKNNFGLRYVTLDNWTLRSGHWGGSYISDVEKKWSLGHEPTIEEDVIMYHSTTIGGQTDAQANSIKIDKSDPEDAMAYAIRLTIDEYNAALLVANDITVKHVGDENFGPTTKEDLQIESDIFSNGALITGKKSTNSQATYLFYTKAYKAGTYGYINQFIGIPFVQMNAYEYYDSYLYEYEPNDDKWITCSTTMYGFKAYNLLRASKEGRSSYYLDGTLNLPGIEDGDKEKVLTCTSSRYADASLWNGEHMFANSWTAPIEVGAMDATDFDGVDPTIYIFNAGSVKGVTDTTGYGKELGDNPGQWTALPVADVRANPGEYPYKVIPGTQAFLVRATAEHGTVTLDYKKHVYDPAIANKGVDVTPTRAPKHNTDNLSTRLKLVVVGEGIYKDETQIHERADFSFGHDAGWDGYKINGNAHSPQLYTVSNAKQMSVNAIPDMEGTVVGFRKGSDDDIYTFSFIYDGEEEYYLNDLKEQTSTLISNENTYMFSAESGDAEARFIISASPIAPVITGVEQTSSKQDAKARKVMINDHIYIIRGGKMYSIDGAMVK